MSGTIKESVRCKGWTKNGIRCKKYTTFYPRKCGTHTEDFKLQKSTIPRAGKGLFVKKDFATHEKLGDYKGQRMSVAAFGAQVPDSAYGYRFKGKIIDAKKTQSCITRNINDARDDAKTNCEFVDRIRQNKVECLATKPIKSGSEVFVDYGPNYWPPVKGAKGAKGRKGAKGGAKGAKGLAAVKRGAPVGGIRLKGGAFRAVAVKGGPRVKAVKTGVRVKGGRFRPMALKRGARV